MRRSWFGVLTALLWLWFEPVTASAELTVDGVPLPIDVLQSAAVPPNPPTDFNPGAAWLGTWDGRLKHILVIESITADGAVNLA